MTIDIAETAGVICPLWFGHNLEHTRSCLWQGLSAQLIRNRKFAGEPGRTGVAAHWRRVGPRGCLFMVEQSRGIHGTTGETYTAHWDPDLHSGKQSQRIQSFKPAVPCGVAQHGVFLTGGRQYVGCVAVRSDRELPVQVRVRPSRSGEDYFTSTAMVRPDQWIEHEFAFVAPVTDNDACLEVTTDAPGVVWLGAVSLRPGDHFHGLRRDVIELLKEIRVPILRWPGGNFAGSYRWRDGLLPVDRRAPLWGGGILPHTDGFDDHEIGTDEYIALCRELGAEPWITINMSLEGPAEAGAWVEYCNGSPDTEWGQRRAERGHPEPYNVKYWTLGNEMGYSHMRGPNDPRGYSELAAGCAEAMKEADPSIVLVGSDSPNKQEWYTEVSRRLGEHMDHISYHEYTDLVKAYEGDEAKRELERVATAPANTLRMLRQVRAWLDANAPGGKFIGISFDEWNMWRAWSRVPGVVEGIYTACMVNMICREARKVGMTLGAYFEPVNEGAILVTPESCQLTPAGQVFAMLKSHYGNELVELASPPAHPHLDVTASVDRESGQVIVTLVNWSCDDAAEQISLRGLGSITGIEATVLSSADFLAESEFTQRELSTALHNEHTLAVSVPRHSVARLQVSFR